MTVLLLLALAHAAPVDEPGPAHIVNGQEVTGDRWPAAVSLGFDFGRRMSTCSGSLITPKLVLTAGHCTRELVAEYGLSEADVVPFLRVFFGNDVNDPATRSVGLADIRVHPDYLTRRDGQPVDDISVLELAEEVTDIEPVWFRDVPLPAEEAVGTEVVSVGFGVTSSSEWRSGGVKREAVLRIARVEGGFLHTDARANPDNANICSGDSGGPQYAEVDGHLEQWGVHSYGYGVQGIDLCLQSSASTHVAAYRGWIWRQVRRVHGDDYVPRFSDWDWCEARGRYLDGTCDPGCEQTDGDCVIDEDGDGVVSDEERRRWDRDRDGVVSAEEYEAGPRGCDQRGGEPAALAALLALAFRRRR